MLVLVESASGYNLVLVLSLLKCQSSSSIFSLDIPLLLQGLEETETFLKLLLFCVVCFFFLMDFFSLRFNSKQVAINAWPQYPIPQLLCGKKQVVIPWILKSHWQFCAINAVKIFLWIFRNSRIRWRKKLMRICMYIYIYI